jgi:DNA-damage-inducible protein D
MNKELIAKLFKNFEESAHIDGEVEYWFARELQILLGYNDWRNFEVCIEKAKIACTTAKQKISDHFSDVGKMIAMPKLANKEIKDIKLTRYACYLIAQNGDPRKEQIAFAMNYFAIQTRKQELLEQRMNDWERVQAREKLTLSEKELAGIIFERDVDTVGFARIKSKGDAALFGGYNTSDMKLRLEVPKKRPLADFLPTVTIKAKDFANEITSHNLKKDRTLQGEPTITNEHITNNKNVREVLTKTGIFPESLSKGEDILKTRKNLTGQKNKKQRPSSIFIPLQKKK